MKNKKQKYDYPEGMNEEEKLLYRMEIKIQKMKDDDYKKRRDILLNKNKPKNNQQIYKPKVYSGPIHRAKSWYGF
jgi:hypothetical protein